MSKAPRFMANGLRELPSDVKAHVAALDKAKRQRGALAREAKVQAVRKEFNDALRGVHNDSGLLPERISMFCQIAQSEDALCSLETAVTRLRDAFNAAQEIA